MYAILSGCQEGVIAGNNHPLGILSSGKDDEMLKLTDSGCAQHCPLQTTLTGVAAVLVARLILNLPPTVAGPTYICERGNTHRLMLHHREEKSASTSPRPGLAGGRPPSH